MGVEYIISERLFKQLPAQEKQYWHSHRYEVKSGTLIAPGLPPAAEHALMSKIVNTYGKTGTRHTDRDKTLPLGAPTLMMGFTADGQLNPALLADRDKRFDVDTATIRTDRADIAAHPVAEGPIVAGACIRNRRFRFTRDTSGCAHRRSGYRWH